ncbi:hypothetical protein CB1_001107047 [Camelus ferus]|nr:hypothetical protein CB1_001107047 [Camelus ferus]
MAAYQDLKPSHPKPTLLDSTIMPYLTVVTEARKVLRQILMYTYIQYSVNFYVMLREDVFPTGVLTTIRCAFEERGKEDP